MPAINKVCQDQDGRTGNLRGLIQYPQHINIGPMKQWWCSSYQNEDTCWSHSIRWVNMLIHVLFVLQFKNSHTQAKKSSDQNTTVRSNENFWISPSPVLRCSGWSFMCGSNRLFFYIWYIWYCRVRIYSPGNTIANIVLRNIQHNARFRRLKALSVVSGENCRNWSCKRRSFRKK